MFEVPDAKRVRRDELHSPASSPRSSPDPDLLQDFFRSQISTQFTFTTTDEHVAQDALPSDDDETELRLFAAPSNAPVQTHKIRLSSPGADLGEPGLLVKKPRSYYFADDPTSDEEVAFQAAAIDGRSVLELSRQPWPGCALPWKVCRISAAGMRKEVLVGHPPILATLEEKQRRRTRKGKKARIALRQKLQVSKEKETEQARLAQEKAEAEREKKTRRNREKKLKKKAKGQAKKAADGAAEDVVEGPEASVQDTAADTQPMDDIMT
ncbi:dolichyl pyrophosphate phosphatase [Pyrenophora seminiperda CCB06]|uniref:Dolichyl pyrophosphate phosphatase n=1 Tax=Pyrenophora seminiperda CCB06 TaxID=1302712 RepID=A0A3M7LXT4_9PLEO|nr:dolichyl pyrophosphate phosphatase [Pyrenophora seminiperda CCB06]